MNPVTDCHPPRLPDRDQGQTQPGATGLPTLETPLSSEAIREAWRPAPPLPACGPRTNPQRDSLVLHTGALNFHSWGQTQNSQKILTPKSPVSAYAHTRIHTHTHTKFRACSRGQYGHTLTGAVALSSTPRPSTTGMAGDQAGSELSRGLGMGKQGLLRGEGDSGEKEEKGSKVHSAHSTGAPSKDKLELPWAGCQTQYLSPQQPRGGPARSALDDKWTRYVPARRDKGCRCKEKVGFSRMFRNTFQGVERFQGHTGSGPARPAPFTFFKIPS